MRNNNQIVFQIRHISRPHTSPWGGRWTNGAEDDTRNFFDSLNIPLMTENAIKNLEGEIKRQTENSTKHQRTTFELHHVKMEYSKCVSFMTYHISPTFPRFELISAKYT